MKTSLTTICFLLLLSGRSFAQGPSDVFMADAAFGGLLVVLDVGVVTEAAMVKAFKAYGLKPVEPTGWVKADATGFLRGYVTTGDGYTGVNLDFNPLGSTNTLAEGVVQGFLAQGGSGILLAGGTSVKVRLGENNRTHCGGIRVDHVTIDVVKNQLLHVETSLTCPKK